MKMFEEITQNLMSPAQRERYVAGMAVLKDLRFTADYRGKRMPEVYYRKIEVIFAALCMRHEEQLKYPIRKLVTELVDFYDSTSGENRTKPFGTDCISEAQRVAKSLDDFVVLLPRLLA